MSSSSSGSQSVSQFELELYFLIAKFLASGPCQKASEALKEELKEYQLLPRRVDWEGGEHFRNFEELLKSYRHLAPDHLLQVCGRIGPLLDKEVPPSVRGVMSLLGAGRQSMLRRKEDVSRTSWTPSAFAAMQHGRPLAPSRNLVSPSSLSILGNSRTLSGSARKEFLLYTSLYSKMTLLSRSLGHLSAVYCVSFDRTGEYIFTGADEHLIKVWSAVTGRLLATLRGHSSEITDIAVNFENTLLASGSCDKLIRVWCLKTTAPVAVLHGHSGMITSLQFCPFTRGDYRYLVSTGGDGCVCFWQWNIKTHVFNPKPIKYVERSRAGAQMLCSSFSPGGIFLATGSVDQVVRVYCFTSSAPEKICELEAHTDHVDSIRYSHSSPRFVTGSRDGTARIWRFERQEWRALVLNMAQTLPNNENPGIEVSKYKVTMVTWTADDKYVLTAVNDLTIRVWDSLSGQLVHVLKGHQDEMFVLENNPLDPRIALSAGHDGRIIIWDLNTGAIIKNHFNVIEGQGHGAVFDCKWGPDGLSFASTDSHGFLMLFGFGSNDKFKKLPQEMFFHTDYRPLIRDANNYVLDEQTQMPPHHMAPPFLVNIDGSPYPPSSQRLVPGREDCKQMELIPQVGMAQNGDHEVLDVSIGQPAEPNALSAEEMQQLARNQGTEDEALIDTLIMRMQREQDERIAAEGGEPVLLSPNHGGPTSPAFRGHRSSSETDHSYTQSTSDANQGRSQIKSLSTWSRRRMIRALTKIEIRSQQQKQQGMADEEIKIFVSERKKKPLPPSEADSSDSGSYIRTRRHQRKHPKGSRRRTNEETTRNRLTTRALYDTEEEEEASQEEPTAAAESVEETTEVNTTLDSSQAEVDNTWQDESNSNDSSDYSDWTADAGMNLQPPTRKSKRKRKVRRMSTSESEGEDSTADSEEEKKMSQEEEEEEVDVGQDDADYVEEESRKRPDRKPAKAKKKTVKKKKKKETRRERETRRTKALIADDGDETELNEAFRPPEWLTSTVPRKAPYFPQMGDEVMYFHQGHLQYLKAVKNRKVYSIDLDKGQPWHKNQHLREEELVKVIGVRYEICPPRLVCLKLAQIDPDSGRMVGGTFSIKYHDMPDVIDFIILRQTFENAMRRDWRVGDSFRSLIDDAWWMGKIIGQEPFNAEYPDSHFQCFNVEWDTSEHEKMSPWDLEAIDENRKPSNVGGGMHVTESELLNLVYVPKKSEWPEIGRNAECERIQRGLEEIMQLSIAEPFLVPVDLNQFPLYAKVIQYPIDFTTIKSRLENRFYRRISAIVFDVRYIEHNARTFNEASSQIVELAKLCTELCQRFIQDPNCTDPHAIYTQLSHDHDFAITSSSSRRKDSDRELPSRRMSRSLSSHPENWKTQCSELLRTILECDDSLPFRSPVDVTEFTDYYSVVDSPMDLGTVKEKFQCKNYTSPAEFAKDVRQIFINSKSYNTNKRSRVYAMTLRLSAMFEDQFHSILSDWRSAKRNNQSNQAARSGSRSVSRKDTRSQPKSSTLSQRNQASTSVRTVRSPPSAPSSSRRRTAHPTSSSSKRQRHSSESSEHTSPSRRKKSRQEVNIEDLDEDDGEQQSSSDSADSVDDDSEYEAKPKRKPVTRSARPKKSSPPEKPKAEPITNGQSSYSTRCSTGRLKRKNYNRDSSGEEEVHNGVEHSASRRSQRSTQRRPVVSSEDDEQNSKADSESEEERIPSKRKRKPVKKKTSSEEEESEEEEQEDIKWKNRRRLNIKPPAESEEDEEEEDEDEDEEEQEEETPKAKRTSHSSRSISMNEESEDQEEDEDDSPSARRTSSRKRAPPPRSKDFSYEARKKRAMTTRNQGKRTVTYEESSDHDSSRVNADDNDDDDDDEEERISISSRGRVRKLTSRARAIFRD